MPRVILLTSTFLRHQYVAAEAARAFDLVGLWQEEKTFAPEKHAGNENDLRVIREHFSARDRSEEHYFGAHATLTLPESTVHRTLNGGKINDEAEVERMIDLKPEAVLVYGTGILREGILNPFGGNIINIHLGLSPYYRGSGTNFWPLVNREPEYVGATIHYLDAGIDTGPILCHVRPEMHTIDGPHDIGNKAIIAAAAGLIEATKTHVEGRAKAMPQEGSGKLYQRKDFNADAVRALYKNFADGMIKEYLVEKAVRDANLSLVSLHET